TGTLELPWNADNARDIQVGMAKKLREMGFRVELLTFTQTNVPSTGAYHFSWRVVLPQGATMYRFGYELKHNNRLLSFTCFAPENQEPSQFSSFVASVRLF